MTVNTVLVVASVSGYGSTSALRIGPLRLTCGVALGCFQLDAIFVAYFRDLVKGEEVRGKLEKVRARGRKRTAFG